MKRRLSRRKFIKGGTALAAGALISSAAKGAKGKGDSPDRPNLLFVFADEMRQQSLGFLGADPTITPNLNRFASESLFLPNAVSNFPVCSPYRAMLLTGKYPHANGVIGNCTPTSHKQGIELKAGETCISDVLKGAGYDCGYIGKWHLDSARPPNIPDDGPEWWDSFIPKERRHGFDFWHAYNCFDDHMNPHYWTSDAGLNDKLFPKKWSPEHEIDVAVKYLRNRNGKQRAAGKPFALFISHNPPHMPFHMVPEKYVRMYEGKSAADLLVRPNADLKLENATRNVKHHFAQVTGVDDNFGRLLKCLRQEGLEENTIVVFTSDHGEMMGSQGLMHKQQLYDESFLVPFLIRWPGRVAAGRDSLHLSVPDLMPTLLAMMGLKARVPKDVQGRDFSGIMLGKDGKRPEFAAYYKIEPEAPHLSRRGLRTDRYSFGVTKTRNGKKSFELFDNQADPYQMRNLAGMEPKAVKKLTGKLNAWLKKTRDPMRRV